MIAEQYQRLPVSATNLRLAVKQGVQTGKVLVFWNTPSRMFVADCFLPGCSEGDLDSGILFPYLWDLELKYLESSLSHDALYGIALQEQNTKG